MERDNMSDTIPEQVLTVLSTVEIEGNNVLITAQLDRKLYLAVNKVLDRIGGKWNKKAKSHVFDADPTDIPVVAQRCNTCGRLHVYEVIQTVGVPYKLRKIGTIEVPK